MVLNIIGSGVNGAHSLTIRGLDVLRSCSKVFIETSSESPKFINALKNHGVLNISVTDVKSFLANDEEIVLMREDTVNVGLILEGDPFFAGLFESIKKKCDQWNISLKVIHNASPMNVVGCSGLQLYRFGETISQTSTTSSLDILKTINLNLENELHTLLVLDAEPSLPSDLLDSETCVTEETPCVVIQQSENEPLQVSNSLWGDLVSADTIKGCFVIVCSTLHPLEEEALAKLSTAFNPAETKCSNSNTLHLVGLGLGQPEDITIEGKAAIEKSGHIFLEGYTSVMLGGKEELEKYFAKEIVVADRDMVEQDSDAIVSKLEEGDVVFMVVGDPLSATTHTDLLIRVVDDGYRINVINNASIMNAAGVSCLPPHQFGQVVSIPLWDDHFKPESFYDKISSNIESGWHTLCLLDIKVKEQSVENLMRGRKVYEPARFMSTTTAAQQLMLIAQKRQDIGEAVLSPQHAVIGLARIGTETQQISVDSLQKMHEHDLGKPLHSLIVCCGTDVDFYKKLVL